MKSIEVDSKATALVLIDLQAAIAGMKTAPYSSAEVISRASQLAVKFREATAPVIYVKVNLAEPFPLKVEVPLGDPKGLKPPLAALEILPEAGRQAGDLVITKRHWSAFLGTELEKELRSLGINTIVIGGIATNFGVESTARDAAGLGFNVVFVEDAMTSISGEAHLFALTTIFPKLGRICKSGELHLVR